MVVRGCLMFSMRNTLYTYKLWPNPAHKSVWFLPCFKDRFLKSGTALQFVDHQFVVILSERLSYYIFFFRFNFGYFIFWMDEIDLPASSWDGVHLTHISGNFFLKFSEISSRVILYYQQLRGKRPWRLRQLPGACPTGTLLIGQVFSLEKASSTSKDRSAVDFKLFCNILLLSHTRVQ